MIAGYPRFIRKGQVFDLLDVVRGTETIVCKGDMRKYTSFYATGVYRGIATGYVVGCCFRCFYCWSEWSRDFPEFFGDFYSPNEAYKRILEAAKKWNVRKARISGGEPTLCKEHLIKLLGKFEKDNWIELFILETNGALFGLDPSYVSEISKFGKVHVRVSLKAGNPEAFELRTGVDRSYFEVPFKAIEYLLKSNVSFHVAAMTDPRIMPKEERAELIERLRKIDTVIAANLEEEICDPYETTIVRMQAFGIDPYRFFTKKVGNDSYKKGDGDCFLKLFKIADVEGEDASLRDLYDIAMEEMPSFLKIYGDLPPRIAIYRIYRNPRYQEKVRRAAERFLDERCKCS